MLDDRKKRLVGAFLEKNYPSYLVGAEKTFNTLPFYSELAACLEAIEQEQTLGLDFNTVESTPTQWALLEKILKKGIILRDNRPGVIEKIDVDLILTAIIDYKKDLVLKRLPQFDYYNRVTAEDPLIQDTCINPLIKAAQDKLSLLIQSAFTGFDKTKVSDVRQLVMKLSQDLSKMESKKTQNKALLAETKKYLVVAQDLLKINQLMAIKIPLEQGGSSNYCTLAETVGGVTEKFSLITLKRVIEQLTNLKNTPILGIDEYIFQRNNYKLSAEAMIKMPKHGHIEEVQREAFALNLSRSLGLDTTASVMLTHEFRPALFIPFDKIKLMNEFARGEEFGTFKTYEHYSTINPVGSGLQADRFIEDFGHSLALFYVCNDTDAIGGYNQNKALRNSRTLYIFDQVVMPKEYMKLDSRLSLQPDTMLRHFRHWRGRNRSLIEDSSINTKFESLMHVQEQAAFISKHVKDTLDKYDLELKRIEKALLKTKGEAERNRLKGLSSQLVELKKDLQLMHLTVQTRIKKINEVFPQRMIPEVTFEHTRQALIFEKLIHNPVLFTKQGRPYRNPWTYRHNNPLKKIEVNQDVFTLHFKDPLDKGMILFLMRKGIGSLKLKSLASIQIHASELSQLRENMLHPEIELHIDHTINYLDPKDLIQISKAYGVNDKTASRIIELVNTYHTEMTTTSSVNKLEVMNDFRIKLQFHVLNEAEKGFCKHVMKKLHFDIQQRLQKMIPLKQKPANLDEAFSAALKLDQIEVFNKLVASAIKHNQLNSTSFKAFINYTIDQAALPTNHTEACSASKVFLSRARTALSIMNPQQELIELASDLDDVDPLAVRLEELDIELKALNVPESNSNRPPTDNSNWTPSLSL